MMTKQVEEDKIAAYCVKQSREITRPHVTRKDVNVAVGTTATTAVSPPLGCQLMGSTKLHKEGKTGKGVRVGVIDSGIDSSHIGFHGQIKKHVWFRYGTPLVEDDHGTHVAGTIHFMAPDAEIYDYRVFGAEGYWSVDDAISQSIIEAVYDGCHIINMSLGGRWGSTSIRNAIEFAHKQNVIVVCAAGNEGDDNILTNERSFPAMWPECISIGAVTKDDGLPVAYFSNTNPEVDYAAIGVNVLSMKPNNDSDEDSTIADDGSSAINGYQLMSGTSMACPHATGFIASAILQELIASKDNESEIVTLAVGGEEEEKKENDCKPKRGGRNNKKVNRRKLKKQENRKSNSEDDHDNKLYDDIVRDRIQEEDYVVDVATKGKDDATGVGFLTYLNKDEFDQVMSNIPN